MSTKRQPRGIPVGGQYAENSHDEASATLARGQASPSPEDVQWAEKNVAQRYSGTAPLDAHRDEIETLARRRAFYMEPMRAFERGETHPSDEDFERMWDGPGGLTGPGFSRVDAENGLAHSERVLQREDIPEDQRRAALSERWLWQRAIETHGRSLSVNQSLALMDAP